MKKIFGVIFLIALFIGGTIYIRGTQTPENFRHTSDKTALVRLLAKECRHVNWDGIEDLNSYGSGYIKLNQFKKLLKQDQPIYVFGMGETYYLNGYNLKHYGMNVKDDEVYLFPKTAILRWKYRLRQKLDGLDTIKKEDLLTEQQMLASYDQVTYFRFDQPRWLYDFSYMGDVLRVFESIPEGAAVYFHCNRGQGRTTSFMTLYDIFRHRNRALSLQEMIDRQYCIGGENMSDVEPRMAGSWKPEALIQRKNLVELFYTYMHDAENGYGKQTWQDWSKTQNVQVNDIVIEYKKEGTDA